MDGRRISKILFVVSGGFEGLDLLAVPCVRIWSLVYDVSQWLSPSWMVAVGNPHRVCPSAPLLVLLFVCGGQGWTGQTMSGKLPHRLGLDYRWLFEPDMVYRTWLVRA